MLTVTEVEDKLREIKPILTERFFVSSIGYFGSFYKNEQTSGSDLDILVEFSKPVGWEFFTLEKFLEQSFGISIDLVTKSALKDQIKVGIINNVKYI